MSPRTVCQNHYSPRILISWSIAAFFYYQFFTTDMLATLTARPHSVVDSMEEVLANKDVIPLTIKALYTYHAYIKGTPLDSRMEFIKYSDTFKPQTFSRIINEKAVLLLKENQVDLIIEFNSYLPLRKGSKGSYLLFTGYLLNKGLDPKLKRSIQAMYAKNY